MTPLNYTHALFPDHGNTSYSCIYRNHYALNNLKNNCFAHTHTHTHTRMRISRCCELSISDGFLVVFTLDDFEMEYTNECREMRFFIS